MKMVGLYFANLNNFKSLGYVDRVFVTKTQLQVGENFKLNNLALEGLKGSDVSHILFVFFCFSLPKINVIIIVLPYTNIFCACSSLIVRKLSSRNTPESQLTPVVVICVTTYPCGCHNLPWSGATCDKLTTSIFGALIVKI